MKNTKITTTSTSLGLLLISSMAASAVSIFSPTAANTTITTNTVGNPDPVANLTGSPGAFNFTNVGVNNSTTALASNDGISTLLGTALTANDTVTLTLVVTGFNGALNGNGFEFGITPDPNAFRATDNLLFQIDDSGNLDGLAAGNILGLGLNDAGFGIVESSLADGFTIELIADVTGFTFNITDVIGSTNGTNTGDTSLSFGQAFTGTQFLDIFSDGSIGLVVQTTAADFDVSFSEFDIHVDAVPEPSQATLLGLGLIGIFARRRRRA